jgi:hypothetical protein
VPPGGLAAEEHDRGQEREEQDAEHWSPPVFAFIDSPKVAEARNRTGRENVFNGGEHERTRKAAVRELRDPLLAP